MDDKFSVAINKFDGTIQLVLSGRIDEKARFPSLSSFRFRILRIDLRSVVSINSYGLKTWLSWIKTIPSSVKIVFESIPSAILVQFGMTKGCFPENATVESGTIPLFCENCTNSKRPDRMDVSLKGVTELQSFSLEKELRALRQSCGANCRLDIDIDIKKYLAFLDRKN